MDIRIYDRHVILLSTYTVRASDGLKERLGYALLPRLECTIYNLVILVHHYVI
jgi:hypothetical protein